MDALQRIEICTFPIIKQVLEALQKSDFVFVAGDSTAVRAYCPYKRDIEDIDFIFSPDTNIEELNKFIEKNYPKSMKEEIVTIKEREKIKGYFYRILFPIEMTYIGANYFITDFHIGGSVYKKQIFAVDNAFFYGKKIEIVMSVGDIVQLNLPVPKIEELLLLKLTKYIKSDQLDIISLLTNENIQFKYIHKRIDDLDSKLLFNNLTTFEQNLQTLISQWETHHFCKLKKHARYLLDINFTKLKRNINDNN